MKNFNLCMIVFLIFLSNILYAQECLQNIDGNIDMAKGLKTFLVNDKPALIYSHDNKLMYRRSNNALGTSWGTAVIIANASNNNAAGLYSVSTEYDVHDFLPDYSNNTMEMQVEKIGDQTYRVFDFSGGLYTEGPYVDAYGTTEFEVEFEISSTGEISWTEQSDPWGLVVPTSGGVNQYDEATNQLTISWTCQGYGESGVSTYSFIEQPPGILANSFSIINGKPAIAFMDDNKIKFVIANDANGNSWSNPIVIDENVSSKTLSLTEIEGKPAIAFIKSNLVNYVIAEDAEGVTWNPSISTLAPTLVESEYYDISMDVINGKPAIAYMAVDEASGVQTTNYLRASDNIGTDWSSGASYEFPIATRSNIDLELIGNFPAITYLNHTTNTVVYAKAENGEGSVWGTPKELVNIYSLTEPVSHAMFDGAKYTSLKLIDGKPVVAYVDLEVLVNIISAEDPIGNEWEEYRNILDFSTGINGVDILELDGKVGVTYSTEDGLHFGGIAPLDMNNNALLFDGEDDYAISNPFTTQISNITMETWLRYDGADAIADESMNIFNNGYWGVDGYALDLNNIYTNDQNSAEFIIRISGGADLRTYVTIEEGEWIHVALVGTENGDNTSWQLFLDGQPQLPNPIVAEVIEPTSATDMGFELKCAMADLRLWEVARTEAQINESRFDPPALSTAGLVAYYGMHQKNNCGSRLIDEKGNKLTIMVGHQTNGIAQFFERDEFVSVDWIDENGNTTLEIFPNPTNDKVNISGIENINGKTIQIVDYLGRTISNQILRNNEVSLKNLPVGIYFIIINLDDDKSVRTKVVKR